MIQREPIFPANRHALYEEHGYSDDYAGETVYFPAAPLSELDRRWCYLACGIRF